VCVWSRWLSFGEPDGGDKGGMVSRDFEVLLVMQLTSERQRRVCKTVVQEETRGRERENGSQIARQV